MYTVVVSHKGDTARLMCSTFEEAVEICQTFVYDSKYDSVTIEQVPDEVVS